jgi:membrane fusion protein (multidrug efflux system)
MPTIFRSKAMPALHGLLLAAAAMFVTSGCGPASGNAPAAPATPPPLPVTLLELKAQQVPLAVEAVGQAEGAREVEVRARIGGTLLRQLYREGEPVRAGAALFALDRAPYEIALAQARAALAQEQARAEQARREAARLAPLAAAGAVSQREADDAASQVKLTDASLAAAAARLREAELNLSYTQVTAPIAGIAGRALRAEGTLVSPAADSALLTTIQQTDPIWVRLALSDAEYQALRGALKAAQVLLLGADGKPRGAPGRINFSAPGVDPRLGTVQLRAEFANADGAVLPGQFVRARIVAGERTALLIPQSAAFQSEQGKLAFVANAEGKVEPRPIQTAGAQDNQWIVTGGLKAGERLITDNLLKLRPGAPVVAKPAAAAAAASASAAAGAASR